MMEQRKKTYPILNHVVATENLKVLSILIVLLIPQVSYSQLKCDNYDEDLDRTVIRMFTSDTERHTEFRESTFPNEIHDVFKSEIRRINFPTEQWVCNAVLQTLTGGNTKSSDDKKRALYKVDNYYFLIVYKYYTAKDGSQLIEEPSTGALFDSSFNLVEIIGM